ncbi:pyridine nucleotide-disulfide oxidoreductase domain-containing protein 2-like [Oratosquilla oratoria]|uniref:pyridine nucleotide-disulfide oxidoreductase domain-containing protein 2-like n=1 Tax=Oratosquilla oratoria TaxID=337810 RepID=UPI003F75C1EA
MATIRVTRNNNLLFKCLSSKTVVRHASTLEPGAKYDSIVIGGGHNGLVAAAYLAKGGHRVCVLERRHVLGGAAVTEEIVPGFKFSRASYVLGLLRPLVYEDLDLKRHGLKVYPRIPSSYTPLHESSWSQGSGRSLILGTNHEEDQRQIAQFSEKDAHAMPKFEALLNKCAEAVAPLLDNSPPDVNKYFSSGLMGKLQQLPQFLPLLKTGQMLGKDLLFFYEMLTGPTTKILDHWFESEPLKATLATDSVIGAMISPSTPGSGYVLLHHVMAALAGVRGAWGYPEGGMGGVTQAMARSAREAGAELYTSQEVQNIVVDGVGEVVGVETAEGKKVYAKHVLSNATPHITFNRLLPDGILPEEYKKAIQGFDYTSPVCKLNVALKSLPNFVANPNMVENGVMPHHHCTIHLNCEKTELLEEAYLQAKQGLIPDNPMIEMTLPSSVDKTLAPPGCHVALFFTQYVPYHLAGGKKWDDETKHAYANKIFDVVEGYAPGFKESIIGYEVLPPPELERIFGLTGGNIFHGAMSLHQLYMCRPSPSLPTPYTPVKGLWLCGAGAHPGGGVMGAPGRLAALAALAQK